MKNETVAFSTYRYCIWAIMALSVVLVAVLAVGIPRVVWLGRALAASKDSLKTARIFARQRDSVLKKTLADSNAAWSFHLHKDTVHVQGDSIGNHCLLALTAFSILERPKTPPRIKVKKDRPAKLSIQALPGDKQTLELGSDQCRQELSSLVKGYPQVGTLLTKAQSRSEIINKQPPR